MPKRVYQPKKMKRVRKHGFRARQKTHNGRKVIKHRRFVGRKKITL